MDEQNEIEIRDFRASIYELNRIILLDRREVPELMDEIVKEKDFTITYKNEEEEWITTLVKASTVQTKVNNGEIEIGGMVTSDEQEESEEEWE